MKLAKAVAIAAGLAVVATAPGMTVQAATKTKSLLNGKIQCKNQYKGKKVRVMASIKGDEAANIEKAYAEFETCTGADVIWEGNDGFEQQLQVRIQGNNAPDIAVIPQPGMIQDLGKAGKLKALPSDMATQLKTAYIGGWTELGTVNGKAYGLPLGANVKSFVWYSPKMFKDKGYAVPKTLEDLKALSDKIAGDGGTAWCAGIESGAATGWPATDWVEDFMLRVNGPEVYDQWVAHKIAFNDPKVKAAVDMVGSYLKNAKYFGSENGVKAIATTNFGDGGLPILDGKCYMHRQASFYTAFWPKGTTFGDSGQVNVFYLPSKAGGKKVMLGGGELLVSFNTNKQTQDTMRFLSSVTFANNNGKTGARLSPRKDFDTASLSDPMVKKFADELKSSDVFRFDGSDMMPKAVGAGTFWTEATAWIVGGSTDDMLSKIEASWPKS